MALYRTCLDATIFNSGQFLPRRLRARWVNAQRQYLRGVRYEAIIQPLYDSLSLDLLTGLPSVAPMKPISLV